MPRKEDIQMMTGEYFLSNKAKEQEKREKKREQKESRKEQRAVQRNSTLDAPDEDQPDEPAAAKYVNKKPSSVDELKKKFLKSKK